MTHEEKNRNRHRNYRMMGLTDKEDKTAITNILNKVKIGSIVKE